MVAYRPISQTKGPVLCAAQFSPVTQPLGPPGHTGALFSAVHENPLSRPPKNGLCQSAPKTGQTRPQDRKGLGWHGTGWCPIPCNRCNRDTWRCFSGPRASEIFTILRWPGMQRLPKSHTQTWILLMGRRLCDLGEISPRLQVADATSANFTKPVELAEVA